MVKCKQNFKNVDFLFLRQPRIRIFSYDIRSKTIVVSFSCFLLALLKINIHL